MANLIKSFNSFEKRPESKTAYRLQQGTPIFGENLYLLTPVYVHGRSPAFTLVFKGKHISSFYPYHMPGWYTGDYKGCGLLIYLKENSFELFLSSIGAIELRAKLGTGLLNQALFEARKL